MTVRGSLALALVLALASACEESGKAARLPSTPQATTPPPGAPQAPATQPATAEAATATAGGAALKTTVEFTGTTEPHRRSTLMPKVPGTVTRVYVREGDVVKEGDPLVALDPAEYELRKRQAEAGLEGARVQLDATQTEWNRVKKLVDDKAVPTSQFDMVDAKLKGARAGVQAAEVAVEMGRKAMRDSMVRAPYSGVVIKRHVNEGEYAAAMPPMPLITLEETVILDLRVLLPQAEVDKVKVGEEMIVHFPALKREVRAKIARVVPTLDPRTRLFSAIIELPNADGSLRPGLFAEVRRP